MQFEWDEAKALRNLVLHGVDFEDAIQVFLDPARMEIEDDRYDYGERRFVAVGVVNQLLIVVVYTERLEATRIISARRNRMSEKGTIRVKLDITKKPVAKGKTDWARLRSMTDEQGHSAALADKDNLPLGVVELAQFETVPDTRAIRESLKLTQREFAGRFHLSLATVRDWEQGRFQPDQAARTLLRLIASEPEFVERALRGE